MTDTQRDTQGALVERFEAFDNVDDWGMRKDLDGNYVRYSDYAALQETVSRLEREKAANGLAAKRRQDEIDRLKREKNFEQSSRLTSEAQLGTIISNLERRAEAAERERDEWRASATEFRGLTQEWQALAEAAEARVKELECRCDGCSGYECEKECAYPGVAERRLAEQGQAQHVAYFDDGQFHWMSGVAPRNCELYTAWPRPEQGQAQGEAVAYVNAATLRHHIESGSSQTSAVLHKERGELYGERDVPLFATPPSPEPDAELVEALDNAIGAIVALVPPGPPEPPGPVETFQVAPETYNKAMRAVREGRETLRRHRKQGGE